MHVPTQEVPNDFCEWLNSKWNFCFRKSDSVWSRLNYSFFLSNKFSRAVFRRQVLGIHNCQDETGQNEMDQIILTSQRIQFQNFVLILTIMKILDLYSILPSMKNMSKYWTVCWSLTKISIKNAVLLDKIDFFNWCASWKNIVWWFMSV